jgi:hypothetical protein
LDSRIDVTVLTGAARHKNRPGLGACVCSYEVCFNRARMALPGLTGGQEAPDKPRRGNVVPKAEQRSLIKHVTCVGTAGFEPATP